MKRILFGISITLTACLIWAQQGANIVIPGRGEKPTIAVPDFRGTGVEQPVMDAFNQTLFRELQDSGQLKMAPKTVYPLTPPQQPSDFKEPVGGRSQGPWISDWSGAPVNANYLAFGYTAARDGQLVLFGWLYNVQLQTTQGAQLIGKLYTGTLDDTGAKKVAAEFAADILKQFGGVSLIGTRIYFVSDRTGNKEIWSMEYDGSDQKQITSYRTITSFPTVSPDGSKVAFTSYSPTPKIVVHSLETGRKLPFYNQNASMNVASDFSPDSKQLLIASTLSGDYAQIYQTNVDGSNLHRISRSSSIDMEAKMNPKTGAGIVFVSGRGGLPQIYQMSSDGSDVVRLTNGEGEAVNPSWNRDGQHIAFAWTRGYNPGAFNVFVMDVATREYIQLTHGEGRNENPQWAPDGVHLVYSSKRGRVSQIWTMLADGGSPRQLTTRGNNEKPVWSGQGRPIRNSQAQENIKRMSQFLNHQSSKACALAVTVMLAFFAAGCKKKIPPPPPPPPPTNTPARTIPAGARPTIDSFTAEPSRIEKGQAATLRWAISNATDMSLDQGLGAVQSQGSRQVFPSNTVTYTLIANGPNGSATKSVTVTVSSAPPPPPPTTNQPTLSSSEMISRGAQDAYFDYDHMDIRGDARNALSTDADLLKRVFAKDPNVVVIIEGHCDERGSAEYNLGLGDRRATAAKDFLVQLGVPADRLKTISYGKERPQCTDATEDCYQKNRRAHLSAGQ